MKTLTFKTTYIAINHIDCIFLMHKYVFRHNLNKIHIVICPRLTFYVITLYAVLRQPPNNKEIVTHVFGEITMTVTFLVNFFNFFIECCNYTIYCIDNNLA